jgi:hypothetical protein
MNTKAALLVLVALALCGPAKLSGDEEYGRVWKETLAKAEAGDPRFQTEVAHAYWFGRIGVIEGGKDIEVAWRWLRLAAMKGYGPAQQAYADTRLVHYYRNNGTDREMLIEGLMWYCVFDGQLVKDFGKIATKPNPHWPCEVSTWSHSALSDETRQMVYEKVKMFWKGNPALKK